MIRETTRVAKEKARSISHQCLRYSGKAEHFGFVLVAFVDVFQAHQLIMIVSVWLVVTGVPALIQDIRGEEKE